MYEIFCLKNPTYLLPLDLKPYISDTFNTKPLISATFNMNHPSYLLPLDSKLTYFFLMYYGVLYLPFVIFNSIFQ